MLGSGELFSFYYILSNNKKKRSVMIGETRKQVGIGEFMDRAIALPDDEFEKAMRLDNSDDNIDEIEIIAQPLDKYERS
jgi:hypothetical protein